MKTIQIPKFDEKRNFTGYKEVKVKNVIDYKDSRKIINELPGFAVGYCSAIYNLGNGVDKIEIVRFYDARQRGLGKLKNHFITVKN